MPRPQPSRHVPRYDVRRDRRRITWLVLALGLVVIAITEASKPRTWEWLTGPPGPGAEGAGTNARDAAPRADSADVKEPLPPGAFRLVPGDRIAKLHPPEARAEADGPPSRSAVHDLQIPPALLEMVQDQSVGIRSVERDAYFSILARSRDVPLDVLERFGRRDLTYAELTNDPERHRGELVSLSGELRRFTPMSAGENDRGFEQLYDGWLFTEEAGRKSPY